MTESTKKRLLVGIRPLILEARRRWYRWALSEICPMHPDVPHIVHTLRNIEDELRGRA